jgi:hypothetical protein
LRTSETSPGGIYPPLLADQGTRCGALVAGPQGPAPGRGDAEVRKAKDRGLLIEED